MYYVSSILKNNSEFTVSNIEIETIDYRKDKKSSRKVINLSVYGLAQE